MATLRVSSRPFVVAQTAPRRSLCVRAMASKDAFTDDTKLSIRMDASKNGCTGMFWRSKPDMNASVNAPDWPRNGTVFKGWKSVEHPGWVKVDHPQNYWLPIQQYGNDVCHFQ
ncbi:hypothetical protein GPECTOR_20g483 [Gonium pectorale]|uniref:Uncharacterized protein n=1 Tax=Gonium pectorale TaxID=33097 RepID=A0A150GII6_GONPE|nr:hypothetical protein GPECTOR_20g483 [Gonium pectorale]|eukprot:KXZ49626.1 hypothetical protein GPECTOR_20g483 [Gonium pectorale]